ncbi:MAG TPA: DUF4124 domain-containing protein [Burkholderiales bacterium]|nr:DUF4124 domain-containing protein [Burkholderiales bacterium]
MTRTSFAALIGAVGLMLACGSAQAQLYHYKDATGHMVYSDNPPPPGTPAADILKSPKLKQSAPAPATAATADGKDDKSKDKKAGPQSVADREADYKKRQAEAAKKGAADAQKAQQAQDTQARCAALQANLAAMQSGQRIRKFDPNGNPYFVDDAERGADVAKAQQDMSASKCGG